MGKISKFTLPLLITVAGAFAATSWGMVFALDMQDKQNMKRFEGVDTSLFLTNSDGKPLFLPTKKGQINLNLSSYFNEEQTKLIKQGITDLDITAKGLEYKYANSNGDYIYIVPMAPEIQNNPDYATTIGLTEYNFTGMQIKYPITISINEQLINQFPPVAYELVVKHELLHTLGFKDLYDEEDRTNLMYYGLTGNDMSQKEIETLNKVYDKKYTGLVITQKPNQVIYIPQKEETLEN